MWVRPSRHVRVLPSRMGTGIAEQGQEGFGFWGDGGGRGSSIKEEVDLSLFFFCGLFWRRQKRDGTAIEGPSFCALTVRSNAAAELQYAVASAHEMGSRWDQRARKTKR